MSESEKVFSAPLGNFFRRLRLIAPQKFQIFDRLDCWIFYRHIFSPNHLERREKKEILIDRHFYLKEYAP